MRHFELKPEFVDEIPRSPEPGKLYVSCRYQAVIHLCACGCGAEISTPLHPTGWKLVYDGETVSLRPSVGNWSEPCQSHYVISNSQVIWGSQFSRSRIDEIRRQRNLDIDRYYERGERTVAPAPADDDAPRFWTKLMASLRRQAKRRDG